MGQTGPHDSYKGTWLGYVVFNRYAVRLPLASFGRPILTPSTVHPDNFCCPTSAATWMSQFAPLGYLLLVQAKKPPLFFRRCVVSENHRNLGVLRFVDCFATRDSLHSDLCAYSRACQLIGLERTQEDRSAMMPRVESSRSTSCYDVPAVLLWSA